MNRLNRSLLATAVAGALCGGVGLVQAGPSTISHSAQRLARHEHMHAALEHLREARKQMDDAEDIFHGHKGEAVEHVDNAIKHVEAGLKEQGEAAIPAELPPARKLARFEHVHHALDRLREARTELDNADKIFAGHREKAIEETDHAIHQLEEGIHDAEK
jgi:phosphoketolase